MFVNYNPCGLHAKTCSHAASWVDSTLAIFALFPGNSKPEKHSKSSHINRGNRFKGRIMEKEDLERDLTASNVISAVF